MGKSIAIMQPYFMPYIGYWQLFNMVDEFVLYDNIKYTKKGWINRNRYLNGNSNQIFTLPLQKDSDFLDIRDRKLSIAFERIKLLNQIREAYKKTSFFEQIFDIFQSIIMYEEPNLFEYILFSIHTVAKCLNIESKIIISSSIDINHELKSSEKVLAICKELNAERYINPIGGITLYNKNVFLENGINLEFLKTETVAYTQNKNEFKAFLSILDVLMFNGIEKTISMLNSYSLE